MSISSFENILDHVSKIYVCVVIEFMLCLLARLLFNYFKWSCITLADSAGSCHCDLQRHTLWLTMSTELESVGGSRGDGALITPEPFSGTGTFSEHCEAMTAIKWTKLLWLRVRQGELW